MSRRSLNDFPKWVEENADLAKGTRVFGVDISEEMTKKELMAIIGYLSKNMLSDVEKRRNNLSLIFEGVVSFQVVEGEL
tara:strand:+ start:446 stop:682 length:237 start_codon:yes stop_codon:yes gene_type:complete